MEGIIASSMLADAAMHCGPQPRMGDGVLPVLTGLPCLQVIVSPDGRPPPIGLHQPGVLPSP